MRGAQAVVHKSWPEFGACLADFFITGLAASVINSGIKFLTNGITVAFRRRLTEYVHSRYLAHRNYYRAAVLRLGNLDNADARIVEDLNQFCATAADLFSRTFKPALDVALSTQRMGASMGYGGLALLYSYFALSGAVVRQLSPPIPKLVAEQAALEGDFRRAHARLIAHAEEVAFLEGASREQAILNGKLRGVTAFATKLHLLQFRQGIVDQWGLKYFASVVGWPILAVPFLTHPSDDVAEVAARYREYDSLLQSASASVGDLLLVYKKLQRLSGFTARVVELLEAVERPPEGGVAADTSKALAVHDAPSILFQNVTICSPDDRMLLKALNLEIVPGRNIIVTGANGAGKTSMFRVLAGLWAPAEGRVTRPRSGLSGGASYVHLPSLGGGGSFGSLPAAAAGGACALFYVPQRPYLVSGTLRDQVTYPLTPPRSAAADEAVLACLRRVRLDKLAQHSAAGLDTAHHDWADVLSGGEKQRLGLARLYYHHPAFAVLDEATSAINPDEEGQLYAQMSELGITFFSIAHRLELMKFHQLQLHFAADGTGRWTLTPLDGRGAPVADGSGGGGATVREVEEEGEGEAAE